MLNLGWWHTDAYATLGRAGMGDAFRSSGAMAEICRVRFRGRAEGVYVCLRAHVCTFLPGVCS